MITVLVKKREYIYIYYKQTKKNTFTVLEVLKKINKDNKCYITKCWSLGPENRFMISLWDRCISSLAHLAIKISWEHHWFSNSEHWQEHHAGAARISSHNIIIIIIIIININILIFIMTVCIIKVYFNMIISNQKKTSKCVTNQKVLAVLREFNFSHIVI